MQQDAVYQVFIVRQYIGVFQAASELSRIHKTIYTNEHATKLKIQTANIMQLKSSIKSHPSDQRPSQEVVHLPGSHLHISPWDSPTIIICRLTLEFPPGDDAPRGFGESCASSRSRPRAPHAALISARGDSIARRGSILHGRSRPHDHGSIAARLRIFKSLRNHGDRAQSRTQGSQLEVTHRSC